MFVDSQKRSHHDKLAGAKDRDAGANTAGPIAGADEALRQSLEQLQTIYDSMLEGLLITDIETKRFLRVNGSICRMLGYSEEELLTLSVREIHPPGAVAEDLRRFEAAAAGETAMNENRPVLRKDGSVFYADISGRRITYNGRPCLLGLFRDVTDHLRADEAMLQAKREWERTFDSVPNPVAIVDRQHRIRRANSAMARHLGLSIEQCEGVPCYRLMHGTECAPDDCPHVLTMSDGAAHRAEFRSRDGSVDIHETTTPLKNEQGEMVGSVHITRDITERKRAEESLRREQRTLRHLLQASDHERQLIAYEIHDELAQQLAGALMQFESFAPLQTIDPVAAQQAFATGIDLLRKGHFEARRLIAGLRPPILDESGIVAAIHQLVDEQSFSSGPRIELESSVSFERLPAVIENSIYRIAQEGLTNACRHSGSSVVRVRLLHRDNRFRIEIEDWGVGFDAKTQRKNHFGLESIRQRARVLGGKCKIHSELGKGTKVVAEFNLVSPDSSG